MSAADPVPSGPSVPPPPASSTGPRAGRNLPAAIAVAVVLAGVLLLCLYTVPVAFATLVTVALLIAVWELVGAVGTVGIHPSRPPLLAGTVALLASAYFAGADAMVVAYGLTVVALVVWRLTDDVDGAVRDLSAGIWILSYAPLMAGFALLMAAQPDGSDRVVVFVLTTAMSDIGGYAAGVLFGRHPMAPRISPKKSWEGFAGSVLLCVVTGTVSASVLLGADWWQGALIGLALVATATLGDLAESMVKRDLGIKDMSTLLPGHGGLMDRLDSLVLGAPVAYLLLTWFVGG